MGMNAEDVLQRVVQEANERLVEDAAPRDLRWAVACYSAERMLALTSEGAFSPLEATEHF
jgi:hypothetical protein